MRRDLVWIDTSYATFGVVFDDSGTVVDAAPIAAWSLGKRVSDVVDFFVKKNASVVKIENCKMRPQWIEDELLRITSFPGEWHEEEKGWWRLTSPDGDFEYKLKGMSFVHFVKMGSSVEKESSE